MNLDPGEHKCPKCNGNGKYKDPHSNIEVSESYALELMCSRCQGSGKVDWITNAMGEIKHSPSFFNTTKLMDVANNDITFYSDGKTQLEIKEDGFYIQGRKTKDDKKIYDRFNKFLKGAGY